jgi:hypothetical protein
MSLKKEVDQLTKVYSNLLKEGAEYSANVGINPDEAGVGMMGMDANTGTEAPAIGIDELPSASSTIQSDENCEKTDMFGSSQTEDSNVSMARSEVFKIYKSVCTLQKLLMNSDCSVEPWQLSKITKAADYICSVTNSLEYDEFEKMADEFESEMAGMSPVVVKVKDMLASEPLNVNEEVLKQIIFNIECIKESKKNKR